jgi:hypothetical protein
MITPTLENNIREGVKKIFDLTIKKKSKDDLTIAQMVLSELVAGKKIPDTEEDLFKKEPTMLIPYITEEIERQRAGIRCVSQESYEVLWAIQKGKTTGLQELIQNARIMVWYHCMMHEAAWINNVDAIKIMLEAGFSPEIRYYNSPKLIPLARAAMNGSIEAAEMLLNAGANIEENNNGTSATPLLCAIHDRTLSDTEKSRQIEMVKFLIKRGANIHASYFLGNTHLNALKKSVFCGYHELAALFRSMGVEWIQDTPTQTMPETARIEFLTSHFKTQPLLLPISEIISASVPMSVYIFPPVKRKRKTTVFVTSGLSDFMLETPEDKAEYAFAEYFIELPDNWDLSNEALNQDKFFWPIRWLKMIGRYPHENDIFYGEKYKIDNSILQLSSPECKYLTASVERTHKLNFITPQDGKFVIFYQITPNIQE